MTCCLFFTVNAECCWLLCCCLLCSNCGDFQTWTLSCRPESHAQVFSEVSHSHQGRGGGAVRSFGCCELWKLLCWEAETTPAWTKSELPPGFAWPWAVGQRYVAKELANYCFIHITAFFFHVNCIIFYLWLWLFCDSWFEAYLWNAGLSLALIHSYFTSVVFVCAPLNLWRPVYCVRSEVTLRVDMWTASQHNCPKSSHTRVSMDKAFLSIHAWTHEDPMNEVITTSLKQFIHLYNICALLLHSLGIHDHKLKKMEE